MGVHDYRCSVCGTPSSYKCGEKAGAECQQEGIGEDKAVLDLFFFAKYLGNVAEHLELKFKGTSAAKVPFIEQVRARVAQRRPSTA
jgi:hypothetical protein